MNVLSSICIIHEYTVHRMPSDPEVVIILRFYCMLKDNIAQISAGTGYRLVVCEYGTVVIMWLISYETQRGVMNVFSSTW